MIRDILIDAVESLSPDQQALVLQFIEYLKREKESGASTFAHAADQFMAEYPELLRRLSHSDAARVAKGLAAVEQWEEEHGRFTPEEMSEARRHVRIQIEKAGRIRALP